MATVQDFSNDIRPTWCPGCGDYGIWNSLKRAFSQSGLGPDEIMLITGIGCGSKMNDYMHISGMHTLHGRTLAVATGFHLANTGMKTVSVHGDGDGYGEGGNHFMHTVRRNMGLVDIVENNHVYGLTKGQYSPTSRPGFKTKTSPGGALDRPLSPVTLAITQGATFVARGFALDIRQLTELVVQALQHRGYALIDVMQPCVSFNRPMDYDWYRNHVYKVEEEGHDPLDRQAALAKAFEYPGDSGRIPTGILYRTEEVPAYEEGVVSIEDEPLVAKPLRSAGDKAYRQLVQEFV